MKKHHRSSARRSAKSSGVDTVDGKKAVGAPAQPVNEPVPRLENLDALLKAGPTQIPAHTSPPPAEENRAGTPNTLSRPSGKTRVSFMLQRPARSVKVAGDFTEWEKAPIEMIASGDGQWSAVIPLPPGQYAYRFIVDGEWCEDPRCRRHTPNGFGSENSVVEVR